MRCPGRYARNGLCDGNIGRDGTDTQINVTFSGLSSNVTSAHIHCCAPLGTNAGVATTVPAFPLFPLGVTSGTYSSAVFDLTQPLIYNTTPITGFVDMQGGLAQAEAALITGIQAGQTYLNIHTSMFPGGEIRGQLFAAAAVPGPIVGLASPACSRRAAVFSAGCGGGRRLPDLS